MSQLIDLLLITLMMVLNGFFAMSELAIVSSRKSRLKTMIEQQVSGAQVALDLAENPGRFFSTVQIGITLVGIFAGVFGGEAFSQSLETYFSRIPLIAKWAEELAMLVIVSGITYGSLIIGELVPKRIALVNPESIAAKVAPTMLVLAFITAPIVMFLDFSSRWLLRLFGAHKIAESTITEEEVHAVIAEGAEEGIIAPTEHEMITGVMRLADYRVRAIMTPRREIFWIDIDEDLNIVREKILSVPFSRFLVAEGDLDHPVGIIQIKDLYQQSLENQCLELRALVKQPLYINGNILALKLFEQLKEAPVHMAVVIDGNGSVEGLVTSTDVLKILLGGLAEIGIPADPQVVQRDSDSWLIDGDLHVDVLRDVLKLKEMPGEDYYHTLAGFILSRLEQLPSSGEHCEWQGYRFEVVDMDGTRIDKVLVSKVKTNPLVHEQDNSSV